MSYEATFKAFHPKPVEFTKAEYDANADEIFVSARAASYRLAGFRLGFAVFTSKQPAQPANPQGDDLGQ